MWPDGSFNTPKRLEDQSSEFIAKQMLLYLLPSYTIKYNMYIRNTSEYDIVHLEARYPVLDEVFLYDGKYSSKNSTLANLKKVLHEKIKLLKLWWEELNWFGHQQSLIRTKIQNGFSNVINFSFRLYKSPVLKFTLKLIICGRIVEDSYFIPNSLMFLDNSIFLSKPKCCVYQKVLEKLGKFNIEELWCNIFYFLDPSPLIVILKNSPNLKILSLQRNISDYLLSVVGKYCKNLIELYLRNLDGKIFCSTNGVHKMFFGGFDKQKIIRALSAKEEIPLSFPRLRFLDINSDILMYGLMRNILIICKNPMHFSIFNDNLCIKRLLTMESRYKANYNFSIMCNLSFANMTEYCTLLERFPNVTNISYNPDEIYPKFSALQIPYNEIEDFHISVMSVAYPDFSVDYPENLLLNIPLNLWRNLNFLSLKFSKGLNAKNIARILNNTIKLTTLKLVFCCLSRDEEDNFSHYLKLLPSLHTFSIEFHELKVNLFNFSIFHIILHSARNISDLSISIEDFMGFWLSFENMSFNGILSNLDNISFNVLGYHRFIEYFHNEYENSIMSSRICKCLAKHFRNLKSIKILGTDIRLIISVIQVLKCTLLHIK